MGVMDGWGWVWEYGGEFVGCDAQSLRVASEDSVGFGARSLRVYSRDAGFGL